MRLNFIDLFCGAGGFSYGLEKSGHSCLLGIDFDKDCIETFKKNHPYSTGINLDLTSISAKKVLRLIDNKRVDLIVGGPPCQGFSTVGKGNPDDKRNNLIYRFYYYVSKLKPKFFIMENVTGLLAKKNLKSFNELVSSFNKIGYHVNTKMIAACDFGVPQLRRRIFIFGSLGGRIDMFPENLNPPYRTVSDAILNNFNDVHPNHVLKSTKVKNELDLERLKYIPKGRGIRYKRDQEELLPNNLWYEVDWENMYEPRFRQAKLQRLDPDKPSPTVLTGKYNYYHPFEDRFLTVYENAKLQGFPDEFVFSGSPSSMYRQVGNAVSPIISFRIGQKLKEMKGLKKERGETTSESIFSY